MNQRTPRDIQELIKILWACYEYWSTQKSTPIDQREICYTWVVGKFEDKYGYRFHQSKLRFLVDLGFLHKGDSSRSGNRRYYRLVDPDQIHAYLQDHGY
jgi:hypothetical protein